MPFKKTTSKQQPASSGTQVSKKTQKTQKKGDDEFDAVLSNSVAETNRKITLAAGGGKLTAAQQQQEQQRYVDPAMLQYQALLKAHNVPMDDAIKKGETAKQHETRVAKENLVKSQIIMQMRQYEELKKRQQESNMQAYVAEKMKYENTFIPLPEEDGEWKELAPGKWIRYEQFQNDADMPLVVDMFAKNLSEPYTTFTYMHFMHGWKDLCILLLGQECKAKPSAETRGTLIGCAVSRVTRLKATFDPFGYIAMLAVDPSFRGHRLGQELVLKTVKLMKQKDCSVVQLETPCNNQRALDLYLGLGFVKTKLFVRYYMDGSDAVRLRLFVKPWNRDDQALIDDEQ